MENYNKILKEQLGKKKIVNFMNYLNFIKSEDKRIFKEYNIKSRNFFEILKQKNKNSDINLNDVDIINENTNEDNN